MAQTNLKSDAWDIYNQATKSFDWTLQNGQYNNTYAFGTVGVSAGSNAVRQDVVDVSSYLSGRDNILSRCNPPIPKIEEANLPPLSVQKKDVNTLVPLYTREKKSTSSATNKSYIPYSFNPGIRKDTQHVKNIVFTGWKQRGGSLTSNMIKDEWEQDPILHKGRNMVPVRMGSQTVIVPQATRSPVPQATNRPQ